MITRKEIEAQYTVDAKGVIRSPGKFEGSFLAVAYFHEAYVNGEGAPYGETEDNEGTLLFEVQPEDVAQFPELENVLAVTFWEDSNGFAYMATLASERDVARFKSQYEGE